MQAYQQRQRVHPLYTLILFTVVLHTVTTATAIATVTFPIDIIDDDIFRTKFIFGRPERHINVLVDFSSSVGGLIVKASLLTETQTFVSSQQYDYIRIADEVLFIPVIIASDAESMARMQGSNTDAILGFGIGSPVWHHWHCALFTASHITLSNSADGGVTCAQPCRRRFRCSPQVHTRQNAICSVANAYVSLGTTVESETAVRMSFLARRNTALRVPIEIHRQLAYGTTYGSLQSDYFAKRYEPICYAAAVATKEGAEAEGKEGTKNILCIPPALYTDSSNTRRTHILAPFHSVSTTVAAAVTTTTLGRNISMLPSTLLFEYQLHYDFNEQTICLVHAPIHVYQPHLYIVFMLLWVFVLAFWFIFDARHVGTLCRGDASKNNNNRKNGDIQVTHVHWRSIEKPWVVFIEIVSSISVLFFMVHFFIRSSVWRLPLPDRTWILVFYMLLALTASCYILFGLCSVFFYTHEPTRALRAWDDCLLRHLFVETQMWIAIWFVQVHTIRGKWHTAESIFFFSVFYLHWVHQLLLLWYAQTSTHIPREAALCSYKQAQQARRLTVFMSILLVPHTYVLFWRLLLPCLGEKLNETNRIFLSVVILFIFACLLYFVMWRAHKDLCSAVAYTRERKRKQTL